MLEGCRSAILKTSAPIYRNASYTHAIYEASFFIIKPSTAITSSKTIRSVCARVLNSLEFCIRREDRLLTMKLKIVVLIVVAFSIEFAFSTYGKSRTSTPKPDPKSKLDSESDSEPEPDPEKPFRSILTKDNITSTIIKETAKNVLNFPGLGRKIVNREIPIDEIVGNLRFCIYKE